MFRLCWYLPFVPPHLFFHLFQSCSFPSEIKDRQRGEPGCLLSLLLPQWTPVIFVPLQKAVAPASLLFSQGYPEDVLCFCDHSLLALPGLGALIAACCCQSQAPERILWFLETRLLNPDCTLEPWFHSHVQAAWTWTSAVHQKYNLSYTCILSFLLVTLTQGSPWLTPTSLLARLHG